MNTYLPYLLFVFSVGPSWALPTIRSVNHDNHDILSTSVVVGIITGICTSYIPAYYTACIVLKFFVVLLLSIPLLWYLYKMCHRNMPESTSVPVYISNSDVHSSPPGHATRTHGVHAKVNQPTYRP